MLTGETGAGKSILLDAFALALGARGDAALVRQGAEQGQVTACFEVSPGPSGRALLAVNDIGAEDELILRRVQFADGRTRAFVNDQPVSVQVLKSLGASLVEIHGQHDERALVDAGTHRDSARRVRRLSTKTSRASRAPGPTWRAAREAVEAHRARVEKAQREAEWLRHAVEELARLKPEPGEETALADRRATMMQAEKVADDLRDAHEAVAGNHSAMPALATALAPAGTPRRRRRRRWSSRSPRALDQALAALDEVRAQLEAALAQADYDPRELERIEERLFALRAAGRKYDVAVDELSALAARYAADLAVLDAGAEAIGAPGGAKRARPRCAIARPPTALSARRRQAAAKTRRPPSTASSRRSSSSARASRPRSPAMPEAAGPDGIDRVEFWVQTNPGTRPGPLMRVASGGELARFLLALKVVLADRGSAPTLVFDEIDTGAGGAVADAIGQRLARLAERVQVVAVTHAPQVAARADRHYLITKSALDRGKRVATRIAEVAAERRREEIARMLAGAEITDEARAAAERLIKAAAGNSVVPREATERSAAIRPWPSQQLATSRSTS